MTIDLAVLFAIVVGTTRATQRLWRRGVRGRRFAGAVWMSFFGLTLAAMLGAHSIEIAFHLVAGDSRIDGTRWRYDFHTYALQLLGALLIWQGVRALQSAALVGHAHIEARSRAFRPALVTLALVVPLLPVQPFFAVILTTLALVTLGVVAWTTGADRVSAPVLNSESRS